MEWVETIVWSDLWQEDSSKSERGGLEGGSETYYDIWFGDDSTERKTGGGAGGGTAENGKIFSGSSQDGQDQTWV